jgi:deazaflavin-dependent oxidoreductase (nitroreductase family)
VEEKYYNPPTGIIKSMNGFFGWLASHGIGPRKTVEIEVRGRKSGQPRKVAVNLVEVNGKRYLVAPRGETEWVRNVRADNGLAVIRRSGAENVLLTEIPEPERPTIIQKYIGENAMVTKREFGVEPDAPIEEFQRIAGRHPVFLIEPR